MGTPLVGVAVVVVALAAASCGGAPEAEQPATSVATDTRTEPAASGGTLRVGLVNWDEHELMYTSPDGKAHYALDPQAEFYETSFELFRCCLLRTLLSYNGRPTDQGGAQLQPDLATSLPEVAPDGLTWTFRLKPGLHYAPPFEKNEIVAADVIRAVERMYRPINASAAEEYAQLGLVFIGAYHSYYSSLIEGAQTFADGEADSITGLEAPDDHTLVVHLTEPAGDVGERFALPATAPIPPGASDGHDEDYGRFFVPSGPYMVERYAEGKELTLVRNPSWDAATDGLRVAHPDRIELTISLDAAEAYRHVESDELDLVLDEPAPLESVERYRRDADLKKRIVVILRDTIAYGAMNVAAAPFDDIHVRRAANLVVDKQRLIERAGGAFAARVATHVAPDSLELNVLLDYDPYPTPGHRGDLEAARREIALSRYDGDGRCDHAACEAIPTLAYANLRQELIAPVANDLARLGLVLDVERLEFDDVNARLANQSDPVGFVLNLGWGKDFPNGSSFFPVFSSGPSENASLVGASPNQLEEWGYPTTSVPSVDDEIADCLQLVGGTQAQCWARVDQLIMERVVPWIPYFFANTVRIVSKRVSSISVDQFQTLPSLDRIAVTPD